MSDNLEFDVDVAEAPEFKFGIDESRKEQAIEEYMLLYEAQLKRGDRPQWTVLGLVLLVFLASYWIIGFAFMMIRMNLDAPGLSVFDLVLGLIIPGVLLFIVAVMVLSVRGARKKAVSKMRDGVSADRYSIEGDKILMRRNDSDDARAKIFTLKDIFSVDHDGLITSFEFLDEIYDVPDYYDPPLYEELEKRTKQGGGQN